jgi:hypothetical protein
MKVGITCCRENKHATLLQEAELCKNVENRRGKVRTRCDTSALRKEVIRASPLLHFTHRKRSNGMFCGVSVWILAIVLFRTVNSILRRSLADLDLKWR